MVLGHFWLDSGRFWRDSSDFGRFRGLIRVVSAGFGWVRMVSGDLRFHQQPPNELETGRVRVYLIT